MRVKNHKLVGHWHRLSKDIGNELDPPRFIVMHYTAGGSGAASRDYMLKSPTQKQRLLDADNKIYASAHVIVDRDGSVWQIIPFNRKARHAGTSSWKGLESLNRYSVGIEIANYGWLDRQGDGSYKRSDTPRFADEDVTVATMPSGTRTMGWENYPAPQLEAVEKVTRALLGAYPSITEILGHQEIAPGRKFDPGPAFPMECFRDIVDSRGIGAIDDESDERERPRERFETTVRLNFRGGPGTEFEKLDESPLAPGTVLVYLDADGPWTKVAVETDGAVVGWVHGSYLRIV
jgi:N-acetylmuramoyl-L-alanine amidase